MRLKSLSRAKKVSKATAALRSLRALPKRTKPRLQYARTVPQQRPHTSKQNYGTPWEFIRAVEKRFGKITWDLAAEKQNAKAKKFITEAEDTFTVDWSKLEGTLYLNPPFGMIAKFAAYCKEMCQKREIHGGSEEDWRICMLVPASVGSKWWEESVFNYADVYFLRSRIQFEGAIGTYPKDCALVVYEPYVSVDTVLWDWKTDRVVQQF